MYLRPYFIQKYIPCDKTSPFWKMRWPSWKNEKSIRKAYTIIMFVWNVHACITFCSVCPNFQTSIFHYNSNVAWKRSLLAIRSEHTINHLIFFSGYYLSEETTEADLVVFKVTMALSASTVIGNNYSIMVQVKSRFKDVWNHTIVMTPAKYLVGLIFERAYLYNGKA